MGQSLLGAPKVIMKLLLLSCLSATALSQLIHHPGGAVTPVDHANLAATANHLAVKGLWPYHHFGKREAEADPQLVRHINGVLQSVTCSAIYFGILRHLKSGALNATEFTRTKQNKSFFSVDIETGEHRSRRFRRHIFDGILT